MKEIKLGEVIVCGRRVQARLEEMTLEFRPGRQETANHTDLGAEPSSVDKCLEAVTSLVSSKNETKARMAGTKVSKAKVGGKLGTTAEVRLLGPKFR